MQFVCLIVLTFMMMCMQSQVIQAIQSFVPKFGALQHGVVDVQGTQAHQAQQLDKLLVLATAIVDNQVLLHQRLDNLESGGTIRHSVSAANSPAAAATHVVPQAFPAAQAVPQRGPADDDVLPPVPIPGVGVASIVATASLIQARTNALTAPTHRNPIEPDTTPMNLNPPLNKSTPGLVPGEEMTKGSAVKFFLNTEGGRKIGQILFKTREEKSRAQLCCDWFNAIATTVRAPAGTPRTNGNNMCMFVFGPLPFL